MTRFNCYLELHYLSLHLKYTAVILQIENKIINAF